MLNITVIQPPYYIGEEPDRQIREFLIRELKRAPEGGLIVLPEYSNAGGTSDMQQEIRALPQAEEMLQTAAQVAREKSAYVAINVLQERSGQRKNSTYLFDKAGKTAFIYDKVHLPPSELALGVVRGNGSCLCQLDGIRLGFMTCYDVYFNEQIEYLAAQKPDIIIIPTYQRGECSDIIRAQAKLIAFRCNCFVARASFSMGEAEYGGCSMIVSPEGKILADLGCLTGQISAEVDPDYKYMRSAGFGGGTIRSDDFINTGLCPDIFK